MKRILVFFIALIYFTVSSGMIVSVHYCMGKMRSSQLQLIAKKTCGCKKQTDKGCCKTKHQFIKLKSDYKTSVLAYQIQSPSSVLLTAYHLVYEKFNNTNAITLNSHSPPTLKGQETYLYNCVFRI
jgi:hypothetical protein